MIVHILGIICIVILVLLAISFIVFLCTMAFDFNAITDLSVKVLLVSLGLILLFGIPYALMQEQKNEDTCNASGGSYRVVGHETVPIMVGKVMTEQEQDVYGCVK